MVASWITLKAHKGLASGIAGRGLVAQQAIAAGEVVAVKGGHIRSTVEVAALPESLPNSAIQIIDDLHLVAETLDEYEAVMLFLNHSCEPNVGFAGNVVVIAMREIAPGEELTTTTPCSTATRARCRAAAALPTLAGGRRQGLAAAGAAGEVRRLLLLVPGPQDCSRAVGSPRAPYRSADRAG